MTIITSVPYSNQSHNHENRCLWPHWFISVTLTSLYISHTNQVHY